MQVKIAGFNIDKSLIDSLQNPSATPEVISAAYARISRSEKSVTVLRAEALLEISKARKSNENIIFEMGHSSVAEHAVFNIDIIGISRLLAETVESIRLASFTEKSQRYVTLSDDYVIPSELKSTEMIDIRAAYTRLIGELFAEYQSSYTVLKKFYSNDIPKLSPRELDGKAKEDARYILPLSTKTQLGMTINARSLENLLRKLKRSTLAEAHELYEMLFEPIREISPSLIRYTDDPGFAGSFNHLNISSESPAVEASEQVRLIDQCQASDDRILACIMYESSTRDFGYCQNNIDKLSSEQKGQLWLQVFEGIKPWHKLPRSFEMADFTFEIKMSESCWAQFKRHRIGSIIKKSSSGNEAVTIPQAIQNIKRQDVWNRLIKTITSFREQNFEAQSSLPDYLRLNCETVLVLVKMNLRELYHFVRLRSDEHAQWEIRLVSEAMASHLRNISPNASRFLFGKSQLSQKD